METYSTDNDVFRAFVFYSVVVIAKMMFMSFWTAANRIARGVFANPEDTAGQKDSKGEPLKPRMGVEGVERIRRNHRNDLENILPFVLLGMMYVGTRPDPAWALLHFRVFAGSRILHTFFYQFQIPQPTRVLAFTVGIVVCFSMAFQIFAKVGCQ